MKKLDEDVTVKVKCFKVDKDKNYIGTFINIEENLITVKKGFTWDGCTCAKDQPSNQVACCVHDALLNEKNAPMSRHKKDQIFYELLKEHKFKLFGWVPFSPQIYYTGVSLNTFRKWLFK